MEKFNKKDYITALELKDYFKENNNKFSNILLEKFNIIDGKINKIKKQTRINKLKIKANEMKKTPLKKSDFYASNLFNKPIEFDYIDYAILNGQKIAFISRKNSEKIYSVSIGTEIENKYIIKDINSKYLYFKYLLDGKIYKIKVLN